MIGNFEIKRPDLNLSPNVLMFADYSAITDLFLCVPDFKFNSLADFTSESVHLSGIANKYVFPIHDIIEVQNNSEDQLLHESKFNFRYETKPGKYRFAFFIQADIEYFAKVKKYHDQNLKAYFSDINQNLYGVRSGNTVNPFDIDSILVKKIDIGLGGQASLTCIIVDFHDPTQIENAYVIKPDFDPAELINVECSISISLNSVLFQSTFDSWIDGVPEGFEVNSSYSQLVNDNNRAKFIKDVRDEVTLGVVLANPENGDYKVTFDLVDINAGGIQVGYGTSLGDTFTTVGRHSFEFTISGSPEVYPVFLIQQQDNNGDYIIVDNFSIENLDLSASAVTLGAFDIYGNPITGLLISNFSIIDNVSGLVTLSSFAETGNGYYTASINKTLYNGSVKMISSFYHGTTAYNFGGVSITPQYNPTQYDNAQYKIS